MENSTGTTAAFAHPYYPVTASLPHYAVNETPVVNLLVAFGAIIAAVIVAAVLGARRTYSKLSMPDQLTVAWFALCRPPNNVFLQH